MAQLDTLDIVVLALLLFGTVAYFTKGTYWAVVNDPYGNSLAQSASGASGDSERDFIAKMDELGKNCVVFYGSQTGTAEDLASRLAKEGAARFGLKTMVADLEEYDYENLDQFPEDKLAIFVLATYGEGEPTDNAVSFYEFITAEDTEFSNGGGADSNALNNLHYVAFGLGNNTYEHYNFMVRNVTKALDKLGAKRLGDAGEGDDGAGTMEEDFLAWKEPMWKAVAETMSLEEREAVYEPVFDVKELDTLSAESDSVYLGELNASHLSVDGPKGPYNAHNPYIAPIVKSYELFMSGERNCLHMEVDLAGSGLTYTTGDHIAVWPSNPGNEVDRFLRVLGLESKRDNVIKVTGLDPTAKVPFPSPTTYDAAIRYHMEILAPISRQFTSQLAAFAPNAEMKNELTALGKDRDYFHKMVVERNLNIAQLLEMLSVKHNEGKPWPAIPFSLMIESVTKIQPRYYSISSSSMVDPNIVSITCVIESVEKPGAPYIVKGLTTNYMLALKKTRGKESDSNPLNYSLCGPRGKYEGCRMPVHIRHSNFKLPSDPTKPIIMVGPGTGVAPFRGFIEERAAMARNGEKVGKTILFYGCRRRNEDFLYANDWDNYKKDLGDSFEIDVAFSREGDKKVYVQHRLADRAEEIYNLLEQRAYFYVCGDAANMAREVNTTLVKLLSKYRNIDEQKAEDAVKRMRNMNQYQEDVWS